VPRRGRARLSRAFSCRVLRIDAVFRKMLISSEVETGTAEMAEERTNEVPLFRW
jgi:hypothetical protein